MSKDLFPIRPESNPVIYAYSTPGVSENKHLIKVGYTTGNVNSRILQQLGTGGIKYRILLEESAMRSDGSSFSDHDVHKHLRKSGFLNPKGEWFKCALRDVQAAVIAVRLRQENEENRILDFEMRPEQIEAVEKTAGYFNRIGRVDSDTPPHFLWNAKMRFGKTFAAYKLCKR